MPPTTVVDAVSSALIPPSEGDWALVAAGEVAGAVDVAALREELESVAEAALAARRQGVGLHEAVADPHAGEFAPLRAFHQDLRDALFVELPQELQPWLEGLTAPNSSRAPISETLGKALVALAFEPDALEPPVATAQQRALSELLLFESVRLRLLVAAWDSDVFERVGGEESDIDALAWEEVTHLLRDPALLLPEVRPLELMFAAASVSLARDAAQRADELRRVAPDVREQLDMRAKLRAALRELRLAESVLLENALSGLLGHSRAELGELQQARPVALEGLSRQAMDQRVSRGRRALQRAPSSWPRRRRPALYDLLRAP